MWVYIEVLNFDTDLTYIIWNQRAHWLFINASYRSTNENLQ